MADASDCPSLEQVSDELKPLLPNTRIEAGHAGSVEPVAVLIDRGSSYLIQIAGQERDIGDTERNCTERARVAAVVIALVVDPPGAGQTKPEPEPAPPAAPRPARSQPVPVEKAPEPGLNLRLEASARAALTADHFVAGPGLRASVGGNAWGAGLGLGLLSPAHLQLGEGEVRLVRYPGDITGEARLRSDDWEVSPALGVAVDVVQANGQGYERSGQATRLDPGFKLGLALRVFPDQRWGAFIAADATWFLQSYEVAVEPGGPRTRLPRLWYGLAAGIILEVL